MLKYKCYRLSLDKNPLKVLSLEYSSMDDMTGLYIHPYRKDNKKLLGPLVPRIEFKGHRVLPILVDKQKDDKQKDDKQKDDKQKDDKQKDDKQKDDKQKDDKQKDDKQKDDKQKDDKQKDDKQIVLEAIKLASSKYGKTLDNHDFVQIIDGIEDGKLLVNFYPTAWRGSFFASDIALIVRNGSDVYAVLNWRGKGARNHRESIALVGGIREKCSGYDLEQAHENALHELAEEIGCLIELDASEIKRLVQSPLYIPISFDANLLNFDKKGTSTILDYIGSYKTKDFIDATDAYLATATIDREDIKNAKDVLTVGRFTCLDEVDDGSGGVVCVNLTKKDDACLLRCDDARTCETMKELKSSDVYFKFGHHYHIFDDMIKVAEKRLGVESLMRIPIKGE